MRNIKPTTHKLPRRQLVETEVVTMVVTEEVDMETKAEVVAEAGDEEVEAAEEEEEADTIWQVSGRHSRRGSRDA